MKQFDHYTVEADAQLLDWLLTHLDGGGDEDCRQQDKTQSHA